MTNFVIAGNNLASASSSFNNLKYRKMRRRDRMVTPFIFSVLAYGR